MRQLRTLSALKGASLRARDGDIGRIEQMYFDDQDWRVRYFVVHTGGWLHGREVLISPRSVSAVDDEGHLVVDLTRQQVEDSPPIGAERPVSRQYEVDYYRYYGWQPYWPLAGTRSSPMLPAAPPPTSGPEKGRSEAPRNPHLRSSDEVHGYRVHARDGEFGQVEDFIVDDRDWQVRYIVFDTRRWLPGKKVLLAPTWVDDIDWNGKQIVVGMDGEAIRSAPEYDPTQIITRSEEVRLYGHYGRQMFDDGWNLTDTKPRR